MYEVIIIGGSYAGLSAAMALGRSMRNVLMIDSGKPCNWQTPYSHNFITQDGQTPAAIADTARQQVLKYDTIQLIADKAVAAVKIEGGFEVQTHSGQIYSAKKIIFAAGVSDIMPPIKGFAECWGISILHCPYCHGYEVRDKPLGIIANGDMAYEFCKMIHHWSKDLTLFCNGASTLSSEQTKKLRANNIAIIEKEIEEIIHDEGQMRHLLFIDGSIQKLQAVFSRVAFEQHCPLPAGLGCTLTEAGLLEVDAFQKTNIAGIYAAGDCATMFRAVSVAVAAGTAAGAMINKELIEENF